ncbi:hypothetical protein Tcan_04829 [Toxocara canis]|uniref:Uncharacterized protein n=1 Tax=Toxocara canis TaxID=6265 RepID=A0A0B2VDD8_TOXCA|nr:hypothetical protein Tcan_04829 [Toxocara canis]
MFIRYDIPQCFICRCSGTKQTKTLRMQLRTDDDKGDTTKRNDNSSQTTTTTTPPTMKVVIEHVYGAPSAQHVLTNDAASPPALNPPTKLACPTGTHPTSSASCNIPKRTCSAKPMPPAKPDYLRTTVANIRTASLEAPRKACGGTRSLLSKKGVCQAAFANPSSSSEQNEEQRSSSVVSAPPNSITGDDVQKSANSARDSVGASACGRCTGIGLTELEGDLCSKAAQALSTKQAFRSAAHSNEEIKKPTVKPPPPPKLTASPRAEMTQSSDGGQKSSTRAQSTSPFVQQPTSEVEMASMALSNVEVTHTEVTSPASSNSGDLYQMMPSSVETKDDREQTKSPRFQRYIDGDEIPRVPSIPPPSPPKLPPHNSLDDDDLYEEIEQVISFRGACSDAELTDGNRCGCEDSVCAVDSIPASCSMQEVDCCGEGCSTGGYVQEDTFAKSIHLGGGEQANNKRKFRHGLGTFNLRKSSSARRPMSTLEFDKLLRIKSDIQLNITKKVGQIKLKVTSAAQEKQRRERATSMFYVNPSELKTDEGVMARIEFPLDEECIYGDDWSSEEEDDGQHSYPNEVGEICGQNAEMGSSSAHELSMLSEIERELNIKLSSSSLPDVVPKSESNVASVTTSGGNDESSEDVRMSKRQSTVSSAPLVDKSVGSIEELRNHKLRATPNGYETVVSYLPSPTCQISFSSTYLARCNKRLMVINNSALILLEEWVSSKVCDGNFLNKN